MDRAGYDGDAFSGELTTGIESSEPADIEPGVYEGTIVYDESCSPVGDGLVGCDAGVETEALGTVNFYYEHDMQERPCLLPEQAVVLEAEADGAVVQRRQ